MPTETDPNLVDAILADHRWFKSVFTELEQPTASGKHRRELVDHLIAELVRHTIAEEQYLYPVVRERIPGGDDIADHETEEHGEAEEIMKRLEGMDDDDPQFVRTVDELIHSVRHHLDEEETDMLPKIREVCDAETLRDLGGKWTRAKKIAPTRPHPGAPDAPPANLLVAPGLGLIDRLRDRLSGRDV